jgi:acetylornithine/succinyldiaminopimelate/putrescine aminotransferase
MTTGHPLFDTWDEMIQEQIPNFLRLYLNPFVVQTCLGLSAYVQDTWHGGAAPRPRYQSFLANSFDEALSGAIKLARYAADVANRPKAGLAFDPDGRLGPLVSVTLADQDRVEFVPDVVTIREADAVTEVLRGQKDFGFVVLFPSARADAAAVLDSLKNSPTDASPLLIACVDRPGLAHCRQELASPWRRLQPDIVVFDESFVRRYVPFGAFTARGSLYDHWNKPGASTFHSTTYQPNSISSLVFLKCLEQDDPGFFARLAPQFERIANELAYRRWLFARFYNPSLARATAAVGWDTPDIRVAGHYVTVNGKAVFDGVAGVACSIRGHNPAGYRQEIEKLATVPDCRRAAAERLRALTGLGCLVPAVSGASAVENALRLGLVAQYPRNYVLALKGGFGGKTLLALTGTASSSYKIRINPLYPHVLYVDPFRESAIDDLEAAFRKYRVAVVQTELVQAVGGVRAVPEQVLRYLEAKKHQEGYLLFVDEVQTGMYRTGPFIRCKEVGVEPDLLTIGKGTSDMMFPFAVTLYSERVRERLTARNSDLPEVLRERLDYEFGYKTLLNVLDRAEEGNLSDQVRETGALLARLLGERLASSKAVRDIRVFGLLAAIELDIRSGLRAWLRKQAGSLYVMSLLRQEPFPVFLGYCQYEPHVLKFTPPLSITPDEVQRVCDTLAAVLNRPAYQFLPPLFGLLAKTFVKGRWEAYRYGRMKHECVECELSGVV